MRRISIGLALLIAGCSSSDASDPPALSAADDAESTAVRSESTDASATTPSSPPTSADATTTAADSTTTAVTAPSSGELLLGDVDRPVVLAHAGGDQDAPHSTMYAFAEAAKHADWLEVDVRLTGDGELVVHHDADTAKTTPESLVAADTDLATLQQLDKAYWWSPQCWPCRDLPASDYPLRGVRTGERAPPTGYEADDFGMVTLAEVAERFGDLPIDIEIKGSGDEGRAVAEALAAELERLGRTDSVVVVSFSSAVVDHFHQLAPDVATSPGVDELAAWLLAEQPLAEHHDVIQLPPIYEGVEVLSDENLDKIQADGRPVWVWPNDAATQENREFYAELYRLGVEGVIAGRPAAARAAADEVRSAR